MASFYIECVCVCVYIYIIIYIPVVPHSGGGSFKNRKRIGEIDCCE